MCMDIVPIPTTILLGDIIMNDCEVLKLTNPLRNDESSYTCILMQLLIMICYILSSILQAVYLIDAVALPH